MWPYKTVSRDEFEKSKDTVEEIMRELGCVTVDVELPYEQKVTTYCPDSSHACTWISHRPAYIYDGRCFLISEVLYREKPFIVLQCGTMNELMKNILEDADPFPYDLPHADLIKEVKYSLGTEPYPNEK